MDWFPEANREAPGPPARGPSAEQLARCSTAAARALLPQHLAESLNVLPLSVQRSGGEELLIAVFAGPPDPNAVMAARFATGMQVLPEEADPELVRRAVAFAYCGQGSALSQAVLQANKQPAPPLRQPSATQVPEGEVPQLLATLLNRSEYLGASDIHIEPAGAGSRVRFRVDGALREEHGILIGSDAARRLSRRIKVVCSLDSNEQRKPQEGAFTFQHAGSTLRLRASIFPVFEGEKIVLRVLRSSEHDLRFPAAGGGDLCGLGLTAEQVQLLSACLAANTGAILLSGPTGSGKSTLLYALLQRLNEEWRNIVTLEDPIERILPGVNQTGIDEPAGCSYAELLPRLLRQDPDVVMIGEIREAETARVALGAAVCGTLVLSTLHAGDTLEALVRLGQLGISAELLTAAVRLLVAQRLVPRNCVYCRISERPTPLIAHLFRLEPTVVLHRAQGCVQCRFTGIAGRIAVFELLPLTPALRSAIQDASQALANATTIYRREEIFRAAHAAGFYPLRLAVRSALISGEIASESAAHAVGAPAAHG